MRIRLYPYFVAFLLLLNCSFEHKDRDSSEYIVFGRYCGECMGHCATMYKIDSSGVQSDTSDAFFDYHFRLANGTYLFKGYYITQQPGATYAYVREKLPEIFKRSKSQTFGSPDAYDQCGIYIQLKDASDVKAFYMDTDEDKVPDEVNEYIETLFKTLGVIKEKP